MPQTGQFIGFRYGSQASYDKVLKKDPNTAYFCTDSQRFFLGDTEYTRPVKHGKTLPDNNYLPPNSFYVVENEDGSKELHYSVDGESWEMVSILSKKISGGVFGNNQKTSVDFGDTITVPRIEVDEHGSITGASDQTIKLPDKPQINVRIAKNVTSDSPEIIPGTFVFDSETLALYLDLDDVRNQVKDPLKLSLTGGEVTGDIKVLNTDGTTVSSLTQDGVVRGTYLEATGDLHLNLDDIEDTAVENFAIVDSNGRIWTRTRDEIIQDLGISNVDSLGKLAYKSKATGTYTPVGVVSAPMITVETTKDNVVKSVTAGDLPKLNPQVSQETLTLNFDPGTQVGYETTEVIKSIDSVTATEPIFTGEQGNIEVS